MSRLFKSILIGAVVSSLAISPAWADRYGHHGGGGHGHGGDGWAGLGIGLLLGTAVYLAATTPPSPPVYYRQQAEPVYAQPVYAQPAYSAPPVMIQQSYSPAPAPVAQDWWYYCSRPAGYYPYVKYCPSGWTRVAPTPPG
jgi:hypothetical protein